MAFWPFVGLAVRRRARHEAVVRRPLLVFLYLAAVTVAAFLLGWLELLVGRLLLPHLGGTPAVWNTCLVFFQAAILCGYGYAHVVRRLRPSVQLVVHGLLLMAPLPLLPIAFSAVPGADTQGSSTELVARLLLLLTTMTGPAVLAVSASAPVFQTWFARAGHSKSVDPYFLYAGSNIGTLLGLAAHPLLLEPALSAQQQLRTWTFGYVCLVVLALACGVVARRRAVGDRVPAPVAVASPRLLRLRWFLYSFIPCSLLHGVTTTITTDIAAAPLLWAVPLMLYLGTYAAAFLPRAPAVSPRLEAVLLPWLVVTGVVSVLSSPVPTVLLLALHLVGFAATSWVLHRRLSEERPPAEQLTGFYLVVSVGGLAGGVFNALASPVLFDTVLEYPAVLALAAMVIAATSPATRSRFLQFIVGLAFVVAVAGLRLEGFVQRLPGTLALGVLLFAAARAFAPRRLYLVVGVALVLLVSQFSLVAMGAALHIERSFFAVHRVMRDERLGWTSYLHGTTVHGRERLDPTRRSEPLTYFHRTGPVGALFAALEKQGRPQRVCVLGLGIGTLAAYARQGQQWTFLEIDPAVARIAADPRWFHYLQDARAPVAVQLGDGRLLLERHSPGAFDLLVMDAFSSDSVPMHLLTREAFALYASRLTEDGVMAMNVTNRFLDLEPVIASVAHEEGLDGVLAEDLNVPIGIAGNGKTKSRWIFLTKNGTALPPLPDAFGIRPLKANGTKPWTDDHSNILAAIRFGPALMK